MGKCSACGNEGHNKATCTSPGGGRYTPPSKRTYTCSNCGNEGHNISSCSSPGGGRYTPPRVTQSIKPSFYEDCNENSKSFNINYSPPQTKTIQSRNYISSDDSDEDEETTSYNNSFYSNTKTNQTKENKPMIYIIPNEETSKRNDPPKVNYDEVEEKMKNLKLQKEDTKRREELQKKEIEIVKKQEELNKTIMKMELEKKHQKEMEEKDKKHSAEILELLKKESLKQQNEKEKKQEQLKEIEKEERNMSQLLKMKSSMTEITLLDGQLKLEKSIGRGGFGEVYKANYLGSSVAAKKLNDFNTKSLEIFKKEVTIFRNVSHPHVVQFLGVYYEEKTPYIVMELMFRSLEDLIYNSNEEIGHHTYFKIMTDFAKGMNYLHNQNPPIIHRDLKPQNILLTAAGDAKISDFGLSVSRTSSQTRTKNQVGTCLYSAPEVLDIKRISERGKGVDVFAFGIILFETFTREVPWQKDISEKGYTLEDIKTLIIGGDRPEIQSSFPLPLKELVQFCWNNSPSKRPNFSTILVTLQELSLPQEWKKFFIESGVKEEELKSNDKTTNNVTRNNRFQNYNKCKKL